MKHHQDRLGHGKGGADGAAPMPRMNADALINRILDAESEGEVLEVRELVCSGEQHDAAFRSRLDATRTAVGELSLLPQAPDLTARILARVEASDRPFVVRPQRARARRGRLMAACGALAILTLVAGVQRLWPDAFSWSKPSRPVTDLVAAARSDVSVTLDSIQGAFAQVGTDLSSPVSRLARQATEPSSVRGRVAIALMPLPSDEMRVAVPGVGDGLASVEERAMGSGGVLTLGSAGVYDSRPSLGLLAGASPSIELPARDIEVATTLSASAAAARGPVLSGLGPILTAPGKTAAPQTLMLLGENPVSCAMHKVEPERLTNELVDGPRGGASPRQLLPWLDLSRLLLEADGKEPRP